MAPELVPQTLEDSGGSAGGPGCAGFQYKFLNSKPDRPSQNPRGGGILCLYEAPTRSAEGVLAWGQGLAGLAQLSLVSSAKRWLHLTEP